MKMIDLPKEKVKKSRVNPRSIVIYGNYKTGKTTVLSKLDNCLIIDLEGGTDFLDALKIDITEKAKELNISKFKALSMVMQEIDKANKEKGGFVYKYIALDTVSTLEEIVLELAADLYRATPMGANWEGTDVTDLPQGGGYGYWRKALLMVVYKFEQLCETLIITGHIKDKLIEISGKEINQRGLALTGKSGSILCAHVDAVAFMYRKDNQNILNFQPSENIIVGARAEHLNGKEIVLAESNKAGEIIVDWTKIFKQ